MPANIANVYFAGVPERWVLMDAGSIGHVDVIRRAAESRFGAGARPNAIVLTHGHYDHVANALELARLWNVPVYAHRLEFPYLTGQSAYPPKDPTVGGAMGFLSRFFPSRTSNISEVLQELPEDVVPGIDGWRILFTPGHAPGHVSFWRESDRTLVAGDALATADLDTWSGMITQKPQLSRPPSPFTFDWEKAAQSARLLSTLRPNVLACGHGEPMFGPGLADEMEAFMRHFAPPSRGRYIELPARTDETGVVYEPPRPPDHLPKVAAGIVAGVFVLAGLVYRKRYKKTDL